MTSYRAAALRASVVAFVLAAPAWSDEPPAFQATALEPDSVLSGSKVRSTTDPDLVSVVVRFDTPSVAAYRGGFAGFAPTSPRASGRSRLDPRSEGARAYEAFLAQRERGFEQTAKARIPGARVTHRFRKIFGGVAMIVPRGSLDAVRGLPGVRAVYPDSLLPLDMDRSPEFIGAPELWQRLGGSNRAGEGVIVGVLDSGVWPEHPSFADEGQPAPPARWTGTACEFGSANPADPVFACNNKLIGAQRFMATFDTFGPAPLAGEFRSARDNNGHGSHTASTATGNGGVAAAIGGAPLGLVSGIAPRAHLAVYKICFTAATGQGSCYLSDSVAAIQQSIEDGVDVLNFSIGGGVSPYADAVSLAFLDAYEAGVFVAASAGNAGTPESVNHRGPWVTTVAASTHDRSFAGSASVAAGSDTLDLTGPTIMGPAGPAPVVLNTASPLCTLPSPAGSFAGKIVACQRGVNARVNKGFNVLQGGAVGMILFNVVPGSLNSDSHYLPAIHVDDVQGLSLKAFLTAHPDATGSLSGGAAVVGEGGDVMADFSSRGGPGQGLGVSKPDITAPGVNILAAQTPALAALGTGPLGELFQVISGTSMASPHIAGAAALLKQLHPSWTPGQIKSALMTTATVEDLVNSDGVSETTPFDAGSGRVDLAEAGRPGLTFDATAADFVSNEGNLSVVNYPSLYLPVMPGEVTVSRTVKSHLNKAQVWYLSVEAPDDIDVKVPRFLVVPGNKSRTFDITVDARHVPLGETRHATLLLSTEPDWYCGKGKKGHGAQNGGGHGGHGHGHKHHDHLRLRFPITMNARQAGLAFTKDCEPASVALREITTCTLSLTNGTFSEATVKITDQLPRQLWLQTVDGASRRGFNRIGFEGTVAGALPPGVGVAAGTSPAGYLPLSIFGIPPTAGVGDETIANFNVPAFRFASENWTRVGVVSNGYVVVGGGTAADVNYVNQSLPDANPPNNVLAPFWTDLNPAFGGAVRVGALTDGVDDWLVIDFEKVRNYSNAGVNSFQVWIGQNGTEDVTFTYGPATELTTGDGGLLTVGAENKFGSSGQNVYLNGTGTAPTETTELRVTTTPPQPGATKTITYTAKGVGTGNFTNCAEVESDIVFGTTTACISGEVTITPVP